MSEYDALTEGFEGLGDPKDDPGPLTAEENQKLEESVVPAAAIGAPSSEGEHRPDVAEVAGSTPAGPTVDRVQDVVEMTKEAWAEHDARDEPPHEPDDWPEEAPAIVADVDTVPPADLKVLRADQVPVVGKHYVVFNGLPKPVIRANYAVSEDEHVRTQLGGMEELKDADGQRRARATRTLQMRYRGYLCGEVAGL